MTSAPSAPQRQPDTGWHALALLVAAAFFMENLDGTILTTALPKIALSFKVPSDSLGITMTAYLVTLGVLIPLSGWIAERFGAKRVFGTAIVLFTLASAGCAISTSLPEMTMMRVVQGFGGAMMVPVGRLVVLRTTAKSDLVKAIALLTWPALVAPIVAPLLGGLLSTYASWRWIFLINLPLGIAALVIAARIVPSGHGDGRRRPLDVPGFLLTGIGLGMLVVATQSMTDTHIHWAAVVLGIVIGAVLLAWAILHLRRTRDPLLDLTVNRIRTFRVSITGASFFRLSISAAPFLLILQFEDGLGWSPVHAGVMLMALFAGNLGIKPFTTPILRRWSFRAVLSVSNAAAMLTFISCATFTRATPEALIAVIICLSGVFRSIGFTAYNTLTFADVPQQRMSNANTLNSAVQQLTIGLGVAFGALALRAGVPVAHSWGWTSATAPYAIAFLIIACAPLVALYESALLPADAGDALGVRGAAD